jgi:type II secretory pathway component PulF
MERIVMAVQSGLDLLSALRVLQDFSTADVRDPVTVIFSEVLSLTESGFTFESALDSVGRRVEAPALRHAFIHLAVTHAEGGELTSPLRELSDSTQLYYQESVEEEIAKLPVKVTMPLLCTFAGLIIFFLTTPIMQVLEMTSRAIPK